MCVIMPSNTLMHSHKLSIDSLKMHQFVEAAMVLHRIGVQWSGRTIIFPLIVF